MDGDILSDSAALLGGSDISQDDPIIYYGPLSLTTAQKVSEKSSRFLTYDIFGRARASASRSLRMNFMHGRCTCIVRSVRS